jgi:hypothetical protein
MNASLSCSNSTKLSNENIICSVSKLEAQIAIELEEPWEVIPLKSIYFPQALQNLVPQLAKLKFEFSVNYFAKNDYSIKDHTRIFIFRRNGGEFDDFHKLELLVPNNEFQNIISNFVEYFTSLNNPFQNLEIKTHKNVNEIFVCIHGARDQCCGKYGLQLYKEFQNQVNQNGNSQFRIWKSSHIGGHRYAPTFYEAPSMRWYGLFQIKDIPNFLNREEANFNVINNYRGMSGILNKFALLIENELFKKYSWNWLKAENKNYEVTQINGKDSAIVNFYFKLHRSPNITKTSFQINFDKITEGLSSCGSSDIKSVKQYMIQEIS